MSPKLEEKMFSFFFEEIQKSLNCWKQLNKMRD